MNLKFIKTLIVSVFFGLILQSTVIAQSSDASEKFKEYFNEVVHKVEREDDFDQKRVVLNESFENMMTAYKRVSSMNGISAEDQKGITELQKNISAKMDELNGRNGYDMVADAQLNDFANYAQNDLEQANAVTISLTTVLLVVIILLLL
ncbi:MAG: hypothetical protein WD381_00850 [Balneolaceae bacterium]